MQAIRVGAPAHSGVIARATLLYLGLVCPPPRDRSVTIAYAPTHACRRGCGRGTYGLQLHGVGLPAAQIHESRETQGNCRSRVAGSRRAVEPSGVNHQPGWCLSVNQSNFRCVIPLCVLYACFGLSAALCPAYLRVHGPACVKL